MRGLSAVRTLGRFGRAGAAFVLVSAVALLAAAAGFLDPMSLAITIGGALAVTRATFSRERLASAWSHVMQALGEGTDPEAVIACLKRLARAHRLDGAPGLERAAIGAPDPFLRTAVRLALECDEPQELAESLQGETRLRVSEGEAARHVLLTLGKLFPAFGLIGTLIGLALLLRHLADASPASIGPGLAVAVLTTLYGAVLSNVVVLPLATKLQTHLARRALVMEMISEGAMLVQRRELPTRVERLLRTHAGLPGRDPAPRGAMPLHRAA